MPNRANRAQLLLIIGTGIFAVGALGFIAGYLSQGQTSMLGALSLILTGSRFKCEEGKVFRSAGPYEMIAYMLVAVATYNQSCFAFTLDMHNNSRPLIHKK